jgi:hypothetical protein
MILSKQFFIPINLNIPEFYDIKHDMIEKYYTFISIEVIAIIAKLIFQIKSEQIIKFLD